MLHEKIINYNPKIKKNIISLPEYLSNNKRYFYEEKSSLKELEENNLILFPERDESIDNCIEDACRLKGISRSELARRIGISRQAMSTISLKKSIPGVDVAMKCAHALEMEINELFELNEAAWIEPYTIGDNISLYFDVVLNRIVDSSLMKSEIQKEREYYSVRKKEYIGRVEYNKILNEHISLGLSRLNDVEDDPFTTHMRIRSQKIKSLKSEFEDKYTKVFRRIGRRIDSN